MKAAKKDVLVIASVTAASHRGLGFDITFNHLKIVLQPNNGAKLTELRPIDAAIKYLDLLSVYLSH